MFYCTLYYASNKAFKNTKVAFSVHYDSKAEAERFKDLHLDRAKELDATIIEENGYYKIIGKIALSTAYLFAATGKYEANAYYILGVEDEETKFSLEPNRKSNYSADGHAYEKSIAGWRKHAEQANQAEQDFKNKNLARFEKELEGTNDLTTILTLLVKYAGQKTDKARLIQLAVDKIQGKAQAKEEDWYDELSDINN